MRNFCRLRGKRFPRFWRRFTQLARHHAKYDAHPNRRNNQHGDDQQRYDGNYGTYDCCNVYINRSGFYYSISPHYITELHDHIHYELSYQHNHYFTLHHRDFDDDGILHHDCYPASYNDLPKQYY